MNLNNVNDKWDRIGYNRRTIVDALLYQLEVDAREVEYDLSDLRDEILIEDFFKVHLKKPISQATLSDGINGGFMYWDHESGSLEISVPDEYWIDL